MSPIRNASKALADVMERSERRGAEVERTRLSVRAQRRHEQAGHETADFRACADHGCAALADVIAAPSAT